MPDSVGQHPRLLATRIDTHSAIDWYYKESITLLAPGGDANVIASSEPIRPDMDSADYASAQGNLLDEEFPGYIELGFEKMLVFGTLDGFLRRFEWSPPDGQPVTQLQIYAAKDGRGYTATATTLQERYVDFEATFAEILGSLILRDSLPR